MNLKDRLLGKQNELKGLEDKIKAGDADAIKAAETLASEIKELEALIAKAESVQDVLGRIGQPEAEKEADEKPDLSILKHQKGSRSFALKAYNDNQLRPVDGNGQTIPVMVYDQNIIDYRYPLVVRNMFGAETISGNALTYYILGAMQGSFGTVAEGAKKHQVHFEDPTIKTVALSKIAGFIKETDELISDWAFLESAIRGRLKYEFDKAVEEFLVGTLLGTSGIQTGQSTITFDNLLKAKQAVRNETGYAADAILINPADVETLLLTKDSNLQYLLGGPAYGAYGNGGYGGDNPRIWGLPIVESNSVSAGQCIVGAFKAGSSVVTKAGEGQRVEVANTDVDDFEYNRVTIRIEERLALATRVPAAFCLVGTASSSS